MDEGQHTSRPGIPWDSQRLSRQGWPHACAHTPGGRQSLRLFLAVVLVTLDPPQGPGWYIWPSYFPAAVFTFTLLRGCRNQRPWDRRLSFIFWLPFIQVLMVLSPEWPQLDGFQGQSTRFCLRGFKPAVDQIIGVRILSIFPTVSDAP